MKINLGPRSPETLAVRKLAASTGLDPAIITRVALARMAEEWLTPGSLEVELPGVLRHEARLCQRAFLTPIQRDLAMAEACGGGR